MQLTFEISNTENGALSEAIDKLIYEETLKNEGVCPTSVPKPS